MTEQTLKRLLDACFTAKKITKKMPELPKGLKPRHIHVLDAIYQITSKQKTCCVKDISTLLNITMPSISKLINELEVLSLIEKNHLPVEEDKNVILVNLIEKDKRITLINLTEQGMFYVKNYVIDYHKKLANKLSDISDESVYVAILIINQLFKAIEEDL